MMWLMAVIFEIERFGSCSTKQNAQALPEFIYTIANEHYDYNSLNSRNSTQFLIFELDCLFYLTTQ